MSQLPTLDVEKVRFEVAEAENEDDVVIVASGCIDQREPGEYLTPYFEKLHQAIVAGGLQRVTLDFRELSLVNSTGIVCILAWVKKVQGLDEPYRLRILHDPEVLWHRVTLKSLQAMAPEVIEVL